MIPDLSAALSDDESGNMNCPICKIVIKAALKEMGEDKSKVSCVVCMS